MEKEEKNDPSEALIARIRDRADNLYRSRQMLCTEAVLTALNQGLDGGLTDAQAAAMAAPFCVALGDSGCLCGALSGAVMASGLLLGQQHAFRHRKAMRASARQLHDAFKSANGATCCRVLTRKVKDDPKAHFQHCAGLTAQAAELAARLVLDKQPELASRANNGFLDRHQSILGGAWLRLVNYFSH
jgi:C_GCAxxG_C_C family probable redox protein